MLTVNTLETIMFDSDQDQDENQVLHCQSEADVLIQGNQDIESIDGISGKKKMWKNVKISKIETRAKNQVIVRVKLNLERQDSRFVVESLDWSVWNLVRSINPQN